MSVRWISFYIHNIQDFFVFHRSRALSAEVDNGKLYSGSEVLSHQACRATRNDWILTLLLDPYASLCPLASQHRQCSSSSSESEFALGLSHPGCGGLLHVARGIPVLPTFQIRTWLDVAPAKKAPSGVKASRTIGESMFRKHLALLPGAFAFQISIAQSSPPVAISRSSFTFGCVGGRGCHAMVVIAPW